MRLVLLAAALALAQSASAIDFVDAWHAVERHDPELAAARAGRDAGTARRRQAESLWRPSVQASATAGLGAASSETRGATFSAPPFGSANDVSFASSIYAGRTERWAVQARQPLVSGERRADSRSLQLAADATDLELEATRHALMLRTAERYLEVVGAAQALAVLERQRTAIERALVEVRDRFKLGDLPVTDTHEAAARAESIRAQVVAAKTDLEVKEAALADLTGAELPTARLLAPARDMAAASTESLDQWLAAIDQNPLVRTRLLQAEIARNDVSRHSLKAATAVDLVAQVARDQISGRGDNGPAGNTLQNALVGVQLVVPLYTGGYRSAKQDEAASLAVKAASDADRARNRLRLDARARWLGLQASAARLAALEEAERAADARLDSTRLGQSVGDRTTLDVLNAENERAAAQLAVQQARIARTLDRLRLATLAGRIDEATLREVSSTLSPWTPGESAR